MLPTRTANLDVATSDSATRGLWPYLCLGLVVLVIVLFAGIRYRLRSMPLERDEGEYAYTGQLILHGIAPYKLAYTMKLPGTAGAYALILAAFGQSAAGVHLGLLLVNVVTTLLMFFLGSRLFGPLAGTIACASYALMSANPLGLGLAGHASHFVVLPALAGILLLLDAIDSSRPWLFFTSGAVLGLSFVMKQPGILFLGFGVVYLLAVKLRSPARWRHCSTSVGLVALGGAIPFAFTCLLMWKAGVFHEFWFWTFLYTRQYASKLSLSQGLVLLRVLLPNVVGPMLWIWLIAGLGLTAFLWCSRARSQATFLGLFLLFSIMAVCPGFYFREHYFILMLPALSLLVGMVVSCATHELWDWKRSSVLAGMPVLVFLAAFGYCIYGQREFFFRKTPLEVVRAIYGPNPFPEAVEIGNYVRIHTPAGTPLAIVGSEPEIFFYADRPSASGYIYTYEMMVPHSYAPRMQSEMIAEIEKARPELLIYVDIPLSWLPEPGADTYIFDWFKGYVEQNYTLVAIDKNAHPDTGLDTKGIARPLSTWNIYIFKRKAS